MNCLIWLSLFAMPVGVESERGFIEKVFSDASGKHQYLVYIPAEYTGEEPYPAILFLHGRNKVAIDPKLFISKGLCKAISQWETEKRPFPFIAVFPFAEQGSWQAGSNDARRALAILAQVERDYRIDPAREYLTGASMGGYGTLSIGMEHPGKFAALVPVVGGGNTSRAKEIAHLPIWVFHGDADTVVDVKKSRDMVAALKQAGAQPKYTEWPGLGHKAWENAYDTPELFTWLLEQKRKGEPGTQPQRKSSRVPSGDERETKGAILRQRDERGTKGAILRLRGMEADDNGCWRQGHSSERP